MGDEFLDCYGSSLKYIFDEDNDLDNYTIIKEEISKSFNVPPEKCHVSYTELLSSIELNLNQLYEDVLRKILRHADKSGLDPRDIIARVQNAFNKQVNYDAVRPPSKQMAPTAVVNIEIVEGRHLEPKDAKSRANPFCTLFVSSGQQRKYNTSLKSKTLQPVWKEHFSLPVENPADDIIYVEVWNFNPAETIKEKIIAKVSKVNGSTRLGTFLKNIAFDSGKHDSELIGIAQIPVKNILLQEEAWYTLETDGQRRGNLKIELSLDLEKSIQVTTQEYRHLLRVLMAHQIKVEGIQTRSWIRDFLPDSRLIVEQYVSQSNISSLDECLCKWIEFIHYHALIPLTNFKVLSNILDRLVEPINAGELSGEELNMFWQSTKTLLPTCYYVVRAIRTKPPGDKQLLEQMEHVLNILQQIQSLDVLDGLDLFPADMYRWLLPCEHKRDIIITLHDAVIKAAEDWHAHILEQKNPKVKTEEEELKFQLYVIKLLKLDLQLAIQFHNKLFAEKMQFPYASTIFTVYDSRIAERCERLAKRVCKHMVPIKCGKMGRLEVDCNPFATETSFFALYVGIRKFVDLGIENCHINQATIRSLKYHLWFQRGVAVWLDIAACKAKRRIERSVEADGLAKVIDTECSSSATDTLAVFNQIRRFWERLAWPDVEGSYSFAVKIIDDVCMCSLFYSDRLARKVRWSVANENGRFNITKEWCLAVNNIDHIKRSIGPFLRDFGSTELIKSLAYLKSDDDANRCKKTLELVVHNAVNMMGKKILDLLRGFNDKIALEISECFIGVGESTDVDNNFKNLKQYLEESFCTFSNELNKDNYKIMFDLTVETITELKSILIDTNLKRKRPPSYFRDLRLRFQSLIELLHNSHGIKHETIKQPKTELTLSTLSTVDLIQEYYLERLREQKETEGSIEGFLTVTLIFINNVLRIEILNANFIELMDFDDFNDPSVVVRLVPPHKFKNVVQLRIQVQKNILNPFKDNYLRIPLTPEQRSEKNGMVMFNIEDRNFPRLANEFITETFIHFKDIPSTMLESKPGSVPQFKLNTSTPKLLESSVLEELGRRSTDKLANDFIDQLKVKVAVSNRSKEKYAKYVT